MSGGLSRADDFLLHQLARPIAEVAHSSPSWFDRFYFSLHPRASGPLLVLGAGVYPNADVADAYACLCHAGEQRNLRFSMRTGADRWISAVGALRWEIEEPLHRWRLRLGSNPEGCELDAVWTSRADPWLVEPIGVPHDEGPQTDFSHFLQPGRWQGSLRLDGTEMSVDGWMGQRDRSWGVRRIRERLGMHLWIAAQFEEECVAVHYNEDREGRSAHCDGAVLREGGGAVRIVGVGHDLDLDAGAEVERATFRLELEDGRAIELRARATGRGLYMAGAGYGGWHGQDRGGQHQEHERWSLDGSRSPPTLSIGLTDKLCLFESGGRTAAGVLELALSRSPSYTYKPRLSRAVG